MVVCGTEWMWQQWWISKAAVDGEAVVKAAVEGTKVEETTTPYPRQLMDEQTTALFIATTSAFSIAIATASFIHPSLQPQLLPLLQPPFHPSI